MPIIVLFKYKYIRRIEYENNKSGQKQYFKFVQTTHRSTLFICRFFPFWLSNTVNHFVCVTEDTQLIKVVERVFHTIRKFTIERIHAFLPQRVSSLRTCLSPSKVLRCEDRPTFRSLLCDTIQEMVDWFCVVGFLPSQKLPKTLWI